MVMKLRHTPVINLNTPLAIDIVIRVRQCWYTVQLHVHSGSVLFDDRHARTREICA